MTAMYSRVIRIALSVERNALHLSTTCALMASLMIASTFSQRMRK